MKFHAKLPSGTSLKRIVKSTGTGATGSGVSVAKMSDPRRRPGSRLEESNVTVTGSEPPLGTVPSSGVSESQGMSSTHQPVSPDSNS